MSTKTKIYSSTQVGAPVLSGSAGALVALLDAVLVNGWGSQAATSLVVAGGVATISFATAHSTQVDGVVLVAGATPSGLNGEKRVLSVATQSFTFDATGVADGAATGTVTSKVAPAGWAKSFSGTNIGAYKSLAPESTGCILQVTDTGSVTATVRGYESMSSVSTGVGPFPTSAQVSTAYWSKSDAASAAARPWAIFADDRGFYLTAYPSASVPRASQTMYFGDFLSNKSNDPYSCVLTASAVARNASTSGATESVEYSDGTMANTACFVARAANAVGGSQLMYKEASVLTLTTYSSGQGSLAYTYPSPINNGLSLTKLRLSSSPQGVRGYFPGIYLTPQAVGFALSSDDVVYGSGELAGAKLRTVGTGNSVFATSGAIFFDVTRDWR